MNATQQAQTAYGAQAGTIRTPRAEEYGAFARITHRLRSVTAPYVGMPALASAIHENRRLWTVLAADVSDASNPLPPELRARLVYLAEFTRVHSGKVLRDGAPVDPLIEINVAVMRGLVGEGGSR